MRKLFNEKRILEKETEEGSLYFILPADAFQKYVGLWGYLIRPGEFHKPVKWVNTYKMHSLDSYVLLNEFNPNEYEYMIFEEFGLAKQLNQILSSHGININNSFEEFLNIAEIPAAAVEEVRDCLIKNECMNVYPEDFPIVDGYEYAYAEEKKKFIVETEDHYDDVTLYDQTHYFSDHYIVESYKKTINGQHTYLYKTHYDEWYQLYSLDTSDKCWVFKEVFEEEFDNLPLSSYEKMITEKREIPQEEINYQLNLKKLHDPNTECDFYYSDKMFALGFLNNGGRINVVNIDGELKRYSEMVFKGEQPFSKWDDLVYVGTAAQKEIQEDFLTEQEMMQFAVYMRNKREKSSLH
ncbi:TPA: hypothetical protein ACHIRZ_003504 [Bacillus paranthracis]|uniref:hypothetical protein n=1 Tax=Bacillus cereus group sp. BfR-BA-01455 TaxID=2920357 RepID=UPI001F591254|nr:hypothetical protein [Bacillus cereus group sp. BfR-BA-01455]